MAKSNSWLLTFLQLLHIFDIGVMFALGTINQIRESRVMVFVLWTGPAIQRRIIENV